MIFQALDMALPLVLVAFGGLLAERAGFLNIALEGLMTIGAFAAAVAWQFTGSAAAGSAAGILAAILATAVFSWAALDLEGNPFITGLAVNLAAPALAGLFSQGLYGTRGVLRLPGAAALTGPAAWAALVVLTAAAHVLLYRTPWGLRIRTAGSRPDLAARRGLSPKGLRRGALLISGAAAGLAGALIAGRLGAYLPGIIAGRGWIALVVIYLGYRTPAGVLAACLFFALAEALSNAVQGRLEVPATIILSLPYFLTALGLALSAVWRARRRRARN